MATATETTCLSLRGDATELADAVAVAATVAPAKSPRQVLQNLLLEAADGVVRVTGSDLDLSVRVVVERVNVEREGRLLVNASRLQQILRELAGEEVTLEADARQGCVITSPDSRFHVMGEEPDDYPEIGDWSEQGSFHLGAADLIRMIQRTHFATHAEKTRYAMNGILIDLRDQRLRLVATDGKRMALCERALEKGPEEQVFVVVPTQAMTLLQRLMAGEESVEVRVESSRVHFRTARAVLSARLIEGHFPPYEDVVPPEQDLKVGVGREAFIHALRRAALLGTKDSLAVRFAFNEEGLELTSRIPEIGETRVSLPLDYPGDPLEIGFNPQYFVDMLRVVDWAEATIELKDAQSAAVLRERREDGSYLYLVMPLSLD